VEVEERKKKNDGAVKDAEDNYIDDEEDARRRRAYREPSEIMPGLFVGTYSQSCDHAMLRRKGIRYLLCVKGSSRVPPRDFELHHAPLSDYGRTDLEDMFEEAFPFIQKAEQERAGILIFCSQGVNRAPTTAIGYLMHSRHWSLKKAYEYVQSRRPQASPHEKYFEQLAAYELRLMGTNSYDESTRPESLQEFMRREIANMNMRGQSSMIEIQDSTAKPVLPPRTRINANVTSSNITKTTQVGNVLSSPVSEAPRLPSPPRRGSTHFSFANDTNGTVSMESKSSSIAKISPITSVNSAVRHLPGSVNVNVSSDPRMPRRALTPRGRPPLPLGSRRRSVSTGNLFSRRSSGGSGGHKAAVVTRSPHSSTGASMRAQGHRREHSGGSGAGYIFPAI